MVTYVSKYNALRLLKLLVRPSPVPFGTGQPGSALFPEEDCFFHS